MHLFDSLTQTINKYSFVMILMLFDTESSHALRLSFFIYLLPILRLFGTIVDHTLKKSIINVIILIIIVNKVSLKNIDHADAVEVVFDN